MENPPFIAGEFEDAFDAKIRTLIDLKKIFQEVAKTPDGAELFEASLRVWKKPEYAVSWWTQTIVAAENGDKTVLEYLAEDPNKNKEFVSQTLLRIEHNSF